MNLREVVRDRLVKTPFFGPLRSVYKNIVKGDSELSQMQDFYGQFFSKGDLVFDVGANFGEYSEAFASIGARVVAVEPNPAFAERLKKLSRNIVLESCAIGAVDGAATLNVCSQAAFSTLSHDWMEQSKDSPDYQSVEWTERIPVSVLTLDTLMERHGVPAFVKIDVEGFEMETLKGMSFNPQSLSFEFNVHNKITGLNCIRLLGNRHYKFKVIRGRDFKFEHQEWLTGDEMAEWLMSYKQTEYGDVFAKRAVK